MVYTLNFNLNNLIPPLRQATASNGNVNVLKGGWARFWQICAVCVEFQTTTVQTGFILNGFPREAGTDPSMTICSITGDFTVHYTCRIASGNFHMNSSLPVGKYTVVGAYAIPTGY